MSNPRIKLLAASASAFVAAEVALAQVVTFGGGRGVVGTPGVVIGNPGVVVGTPGVGGWNSVNLGRGVSVGFGSPYVVNPATPYQANYFRGTWNQPMVYGPAQPFVDRSGRVVYPANPAYTAGPTVVYSPRQPLTYSPMPSAGIARTGGIISNHSGGVIQTGGFTPPQQMSGVIQSGATAMPQPGLTSGQVVAARVLAPDGARVTLNGIPADRDFGPRPFISPPLDPNKTYTYRAKATWTDADGREITREAIKDVRAGEQVVIDLTRDARSDKPTANDRERDRQE